MSRPRQPIAEKARETVAKHYEKLGMLRAILETIEGKAEKTEDDWARMRELWVKIRKEKVYISHSRVEPERFPKDEGRICGDRDP
jgi:hypothetical protein